MPRESVGTLDCCASRTRGLNQPRDLSRHISPLSLSIDVLLTSSIMRSVSLAGSKGL